MTDPLIVFLLAVLAGMAVRSGLAIDDHILHIGLVAAIAAAAALWALHLAALNLSAQGPGIARRIPWILALTAVLVSPEAIKAIQADGNWLWLAFPTLLLLGTATNPWTYVGRRAKR
jgi:hypothetical protein